MVKPNKEAEDINKQKTGDSGGLHFYFWTLNFQFFNLTINSVTYYPGPIPPVPDSPPDLQVFMVQSTHYGVNTWQEN